MAKFVFKTSADEMYANPITGIENGIPVVADGSKMTWGEAVAVAITTDQLPDDLKQDIVMEFSEWVQLK